MPPGATGTASETCWIPSRKCPLNSGSNSAPNVVESKTSIYFNTCWLSSVVFGINWDQTWEVQSMSVRAGGSQQYVGRGWEWTGRCVQVVGMRSFRSITWWRVLQTFQHEAEVMAFHSHFSLSLILPAPTLAKHPGCTQLWPSSVGPFHGVLCCSFQPKQWLWGSNPCTCCCERDLPSKTGIELYPPCYRCPSPVHG